MSRERNPAVVTATDFVNEFTYKPGTIVVKLRADTGNTYRGPIADVLSTHLAEGWTLESVKVEPYTVDTAKLRTLAERARDAHAQLLEIGEGIGGLGIRRPEVAADLFAWSEATENEHADTILALLDCLDKTFTKLVTYSVEDLLEAPKEQMSGSREVVAINEEDESRALELFGKVTDIHSPALFDADVEIRRRPFTIPSLFGDAPPLPNMEGKS